MKRRSLFAALLGATAVKGAECISGEAHGDSNSHKWQQCVDGKWVKHDPAWVEENYPNWVPPDQIRISHAAEAGTPGCPFNHDWEKVPNAFLSYTDPNLVDESSSGGSTYPNYIGLPRRPVKPNPPIPGVSRCKTCGVLGMPKD